MKLKNLMLGLVLAVTLAACGDDEDDDKGGSANINCQTFVTTDYLPLLEDLQETAAAYSADPSTANCQAYIASVEAYVEAWKGFVSKCYPDLEETYKTYWETWENSLANTSCN